MQCVKVIAPAILTLSFAFAAQAQTAGGNASDRQSIASPQSKESSRPGYRKGVIDLHLGRANPGGDLKSAFSNGIFGGVNIGYRFQRYLQADIGFDFSRGAANVNRSINTTGGVRSVGDTEYFIPLGGRLVLPIAKERALLSAGGGFAFLKYSEVGRAANANEEIICSSCASRSGRGAYEMFQVQFLVDPQRR